MTYVKRKNLHTFTEIDTNAGLVKTSWQAISERVRQVEPTFSRLVDELNPDKTFPVYLAYLPYGQFKGDTLSTLLPDMDKNYFRVSDQSAPKEISKYLGYSVGGSPFGMVLEKELEYFIDLKDQKITIPWAIYKPGRFFSFGHHFNKASSRVPNSVLTTTSGARSTFMLPNIGCAVNHANLRRDFNIESPAPKTLYNHWSVFKEIISSNIIECDWRSCILYFSEKWISKIQHDKAWINIKSYLYEKVWKDFEYERCRMYYDITFCLIQEKYNLKPNPYLTDTARHLFATALGDVPGYAPACDEDALPVSILQKIFVESYGLRKYLPTIMRPTHFNFNKDIVPIYYSLQTPSTLNFSPKSRKLFSTTIEMRELSHIIRTYIKALSSNSLIMGSDSAISEIANKVEFCFYHNREDRHKIIKLSNKIELTDPRFGSSRHAHKEKGAVFAQDAPFVRGCVSMKATN